MSASIVVVDLNVRTKCSSWIQQGQFSFFFDMRVVVSGFSFSYLHASWHYECWELMSMGIKYGYQQGLTLMGAQY